MVAGACPARLGTCRCVVGGSVSVYFCKSIQVSGARRMRFLALSLILLAAVSAARADALFKVGVTTRDFIPVEPYDWRGAKTHALRAMIWYPAAAQITPFALCSVEQAPNPLRARASLPETIVRHTRQIGPCSFPRAPSNRTREGTSGLRTQPCDAKRYCGCTSRQQTPQSPDRHSMWRMPRDPPAAKPAGSSVRFPRWGPWQSS